MLEIILADLRRIFGNKVLLSPEDIAEIIGISVGQQANMRSDDRFPIPYDKEDTGRIKISIYALAEYLANHGKKQVKQALKQEISLSPDKPTRVQKKARKGHLETDWWVFRQRAIVAIINRSILELELAVQPEKSKKHIGFK
jgi:hypothetical protein